MHSTRTWVMFWEPPGFQVGETYKNGIIEYLRNVAADSGRRTNVYSLLSQYCDNSGKISDSVTLGGTFSDLASYPKHGCQVAGALACVTERRIAAELKKNIKDRAMPTGFTEMYVVALPNNVSSCHDLGRPVCSGPNSCAYHTWTGKNAKTIIYVVQPVDAQIGCDKSQHPNGGGSESVDPTLSSLSHEQSEAITDPTLHGWKDAAGNEIGDKCEMSFEPPLGGPTGEQFNQEIGTGKYWLQQEWSNRIGKCAGQPPVARFTTGRAPAAGGETISFDGSGSTATVGEVVKSTWDFGDGTSATGQFVHHTYAATGTYTTRLTVEDNNGLIGEHTATVRSAGRLGGVVVFTRNSGGQFTLWRMEANGANLRQLSSGGTEHHPSLSPDGSRVAFEVTQGAESRLWIMGADGSDAHEVPNAPAGDAPSWSPDGTHIVFAARAARTIDTINPDGTNLTILTHIENPSFPRYAADGNTIYFSTYTGYFSLWRMNSDGSHPVQLTSNDRSAYSPASSPDGQQLAYTGFSQRNFEGQLIVNSDIFVAASDASSPSDLNEGPAAPHSEDFYPAWAPTGGYIAYATERCASTGATCLYATSLSALPERVEVQLTPPEWNAGEPTWGP
ncbi:MAG: TolB domain protein [Solirubrobacterales bacterium]|nr:TolB domain protein [Solirubrobacterales bacterium]